MDSKEALKRLKQETAPATYMPDFDKDKCIEIIKKDLDRLEKENKKLKKAIKILKNRFEITGVQQDFDDEYLIETSSYFIYINKEQYKLLKQVFESAGNECE